MNTFWLIFLTGLTTGGVSCAAMQGGLLAGLIANQKALETSLDKKARVSVTTWSKDDWLPVVMFLVAKLASHTILGFFLGALGSVITLSLGVRLAFQVFAGLFMFATAMNLLEIHPIFRWVAFQPPRFIRRLIKSSSTSQQLFAPAVLGVMTIFIPCGVTQAMEVTAINSGDPWQGALIMFAFVLGTTPLFATIGVATARLSEAWSQRFLKIAAVGLIVMAVMSLNGVLVVLNSPLTLQTVAQPVTYFFSSDRFTDKAVVAADPAGLQKVEIQATNHGYAPRYFKVKAGQPVELTVATLDTYSCAVAFTFKAFEISTFLSPTDRKTFAFVPTEKGKYTYSCSMGMYTGTMEVI
ncbi:MAG TPA: sulfite exporter TauE/SafE family protein [Vitreimonas sp.]|nr:sulfite exporter TauE/SafE family protein [Vitreimonas sp.]